MATRKFKLIGRDGNITPEERTAGVTVVDRAFPVGHPKRYLAAGNGTTNDTVPVQLAVDVIAGIGRGTTDLGGFTYLVDTIALDSSFVSIRHGTLKASANIPVGGAILLTLAGGADTTVNQALLDGIYGASVQSVRTNDAGSIEGVVIEDVFFEGNDTAIKGFWATGFTRGCALRDCLFTGCEDADIAINGSWSSTIDNCHGSDASSLGVGIQLGVTGNGERSGTSVCNAITITAGEFTGHLDGMEWDFGADGAILGATFEGNANDGLRSQSATSIAVIGCYLELNEGDNLQMGGTNGTDFAEGWTVRSCHFNNTSTGGGNIKMQGMKRCTIGANRFSGSRTQWYNIPSGAGQYITDCDIDVPDFTDGTYITNASTEVDAGDNFFHNGTFQMPYASVNGDHTFNLLDPGRILRKASGGAGETWTIDSNANLPYRVGTRLRGINQGGGTLSLAITSDTMQLAGGVLVGTRTIADGGWFEAEKLTSTTWMLRGFGIT